MRKFWHRLFGHPWWKHPPHGVYGTHRREALCDCGTVLWSG